MRGNGLAVILVACGVIFALGLLAFAWTLVATSSQAQSGIMQNCPLAGRWSIAVWDGQSGTAATNALATCGAGAVDAAYSLDPQTGAWSRWFAGKPEVSNLPPLEDMQGVLALGSAATPTPTATPTLTPTTAPAAAATCNFSVDNGTRQSIWVEAGSHAVAIPACFGCSPVDPDTDFALCGSGVPARDLGALPKDEDIQVTIWSADRSTVLASGTINIPTEADKAWLCVFELTDGSVHWNFGCTWAVPPPAPTPPA